MGISWQVNWHGLLCWDGARGRRGTRNKAFFFHTGLGRGKVCDNDLDVPHISYLLPSKLRYYWPCFTCFSCFIFPLVHGVEKRGFCLTK